jgi:hypothetical protein
MQTKDVGNLYWHPLTYPYKPRGLAERADTQELDSPFRRGKGIAFRVPFSRKAIVVGVWKKTGYTESQALTYAIKGRGLKKSEVNWDKIRSMEMDDV